jgi:hypothetical protein
MNHIARLHTHSHE